jgi:hypothetical protein
MSRETSAACDPWDPLRIAVRVNAQNVEYDVVESELGRPGGPLLEDLGKETDERANPLLHVPRTSLGCTSRIRSPTSRRHQVRAVSSLVAFSLAQGVCTRLGVVVDICTASHPRNAARQETRPPPSWRQEYFSEWTHLLRLSAT